MIAAWRTSPSRQALRGQARRAPLLGAAVTCLAALATAAAAEAQGAVRASDADALRRKAARLRSEGAALLARDEDLRALGTFRELLGVCRRLHGGKDHADVAFALSQVAWCNLRLGRLPAAVESYEATVEMAKRLWGTEKNAAAAVALANLGECHLRAARPAEALTCYRTALKMLRSAFGGKDHRLIVQALAGEAKVLRALDRPKDALPPDEEALAMVRRLCGRDDDPLIVRSLRNVAESLAAMGRLDEAMKRYEEALAMSRCLHVGRDHDDVALGLKSVGLCLWRLGRTEEALKRFEAALAMDRRLHKAGPARLRVAMDLDMVADCLLRLNRAEEALDKRLAALAIYRQVRKGDHADIAAALRRVGDCLWRLGRREEALKQYTEALALRRRLHGGDDPRVAAELQNVATCLYTMDRYAEALGAFREALAIYRRVHAGRDHEDVALALEQVASCLQSAGAAEEAVEQFEALVAMQRRLHHGKDHPALAAAFDHLGGALYALGRNAEALVNFQAALAMRKRLHADGDHADGDHADVLRSLSNLASCLHALGRSAKALPHYQAALDMERRLRKGKDHPEVAGAMNNLATCLDDLGRSKEAETHYRAALDMLRRLYPGQDHRYVAAGLNNLAGCLKRQGRLDEALPLYEAALAMWRRLFGDRDDRAVATGLNNVAGCLDDLGRHADALPKHRAALAVWKRLYKGQDHPAVARTLNNLGSCLDYLKRREQALAAYRSALAMADRTASYDAFTPASNLGRLYLELGRPADAADAFDRAIAAMERARVELGGHDLDRAAYFAALRRCRAFEGMLRAQLELSRPGKALEYAERGRALSLRDVLERGQRLQGGDLLATVAQAAKSRGDDRLLAEVTAARRRQAEAMQHVADLTARIARVRARSDLSEQQRGRQIRTLNARLGKARQAHLSARRVVFNLATSHGAHDLKPATADRIQSLLSGSQRLLIYTVSRTEAILLVVPPAGQQVRSFSLVWPPRRVAAEAAARDSAAAASRATSAAAVGASSRPAGHPASRRSPGPVTDATLREAVRRYVDGMIVEGGLARGVKRRPKTRPSRRDHAVLGYLLFRALVPAPLWKELKSAEYVFVVPDAALHRLPLETLIVEPPLRGAGGGRSGGPAAKDCRYWLDVGPPLVYGPSATVLVNRGRARDEQLQRLARGGGPRRQAVLLGDPIFRRAAAPRSPLPERGVAVLKVASRSAAARLGLRPGDVIVKYAGQAVASVDDLDKARAAAFLRALRKQPKAQPKLTFWQDGRIVEKALSAKADLGAALADLDRELRRRIERGELIGAASRSASAERGRYRTRYGALVPLPGTRQEVERIYRTLTGRKYVKGAGEAGGVTVLLGEDATRTKLYEAAAGCRYLHLATHGLMDTSQYAIYSSLALTQPKVATAEDFGFLTLVDLFDNWWGRLGATELVVLSACDTQRGRIEAGEGVFGLSWGFMYAGAPAVIASLWQVCDDSTAELMGGLYGRIAPRTSGSRPAAPRVGAAGSEAAKLQAFVAARKALRATHAEPYFWAPFIYIGDPR